MPLPKRKAADIKPQYTMKDWVDPEFGETYPAIRSFLMDVTCEGGETRIPGTISIFVKGDALTFAVNDRDRNVTAYVNMHTFAEALDVIENGILNDSLDWKGKPPTTAGRIPPY